jgi:hypothetical protein
MDSHGLWIEESPCVQEKEAGKENVWTMERTQIRTSEHLTCMSGQQPDINKHARIFKPCLIPTS